MQTVSGSMGLEMLCKGSSGRSEEQESYGHERLLTLYDVSVLFYSVGAVTPTLH